jgi:hypothetical protein
MIKDFLPFLKAFPLMDINLTQPAIKPFIAMILKYSVVKRPDNACFFSR